MDYAKKEETGSDLKNLTIQIQRKKLTCPLETEKPHVIVERCTQL